jgi:hypothetical protein
MQIGSGTGRAGRCHALGTQESGCMAGLALVVLALVKDCGSAEHDRRPVAEPVLATATPECDPDDSSDVVVWAEPAAPAFQIGEPLWIFVHVANLGTSTVLAEVDDGGVGLRTDALFVDVFHESGRRCPDPFTPVHYMSRLMSKPPVGQISVSPGTTGRLRIDLAKYAWLDRPGVYDVRFVAPIAGRPSVMPPPDDPLWVETAVALVAPEDPRAVVLALEQERRRAESERDPRGSERNTYNALGHPLYVPVLESFAASSAGGDDDDGVSFELAIAGLTACPCVEATAALLRLDEQVLPGGSRRRVRSALKQRLPAPFERDASTQWFVDQVWDAATKASVIERAHRAREDRRVNERGMYSADFHWGDMMLARLGAHPGPDGE